MSRQHYEMMSWVCFITLTDQASYIKLTTTATKKNTEKFVSLKVSQNTISSQLINCSLLSQVCNDRK